MLNVLPAELRDSARHIRDEFFTAVDIEEPVKEVSLDDTEDLGVVESGAETAVIPPFTLTSKPSAACAMISAVSTSNVWFMNSVSSSLKAEPKAVRRSFAHNSRLRITSELSAFALYKSLNAAMSTRWAGDCAPSRRMISAGVGFTFSWVDKTASSHPTRTAGSLPVKSSSATRRRPSAPTLNRSQRTPSVRTPA